MPPAKKPSTDEPSTSEKRKLQPRKKVRKRSGQLKNNRKLEQKIRSLAWIVPDSVDNLKNKCTACNVSMNAGQSAASHLKHIKHRSNVLSISAREVELKFSLLFVEHNIPFDIAEHLGPLLKDCFFDSMICEEVTVDKEKVRNTVISSIGPNIKSELANKLRTCKFSILADELTDISSAKTFCITVRYFDDADSRIKISFWKLSSTENSNVVNQRAAAEHFYEDIKKSFKAFNIPDENIVGFGSDGCNDIMNGQNSVASRFAEDYPGIALARFIYGSIHLCTSEACKSLPSQCEELVHTVHFYLQTRVKKSVELIQFQELLDLDPRKMLHPSQTYWLSLTAVVNCMLEQWPALTRFFNNINVPEEIVSRGLVLVWLQDPFIKLYYHFLQWVLPRFNNLNAYFLSSKVVITELKADFEKLFKGILKCFLNNEYVDRTELQNIDPAVRANHVSDKDMLLGGFVRTVINRNADRLPDISSEWKAFYDNCRRFLQAGAVEIKKRWDFGDPTIAHIAALHPDVSRGSSNSVRLSSIRSLAEALPRISLGDRDWQQQIDVRWRELLLTNFPEDITKENEPDVFWGKILNWKNGAGEKEFSVLARFALDALISPHTNADYERIFSKINLMRTRTSNTLESDCEAIYHAIILSDDMKRNGNCRVSFLPSNIMTNSISTSNTLNGKPDAIASTSRN